MTEQEKPRSPEELHTAIRELYFRIPQYFEGERQVWERLVHRKNSELKPLITEKFDELISRFPTTSSYKSMMKVLVNRVLSFGRSPDPLTKLGRARTDDDLALFQSLNLDSDKPAGTFSLEGAKRAEHILFTWSEEHFSESVGAMLSFGLDPSDSEALRKEQTLPEFTALDLKNFLLNWWNEYKTLYGQPLIDETEH